MPLQPAATCAVLVVQNAPAVWKIFTYENEVKAASLPWLLQQAVQCVVCQALPYIHLHHIATYLTSKRGTAAKNAFH